MGVGDDFSRFKDAYDIDAATMSSIGYRYRRITRQLNQDFWSTDSDTAHSLYVGSYGRDTAAKGLSDLDVGFVLPNAVYHRYDAHLGNGQSALLQEVKASIRRTYSTSDSFGDGQVVVISFTDGITFEILPAFLNDDGRSWTYPSANGGGSWKTCDPRAEMRAVQERSTATKRNLKHICRMVRVWRDVHAVPMSGMLIDTLAYQFIGAWPHREQSFLYHDFMARDFFLFLSKQVPSQTYWRAPGSGALVTRKGSFERKAGTAYTKALEAIAADVSGYEWSRRQKWREVFGSLYPA